MGQVRVAGVVEIKLNRLDSGTTSRHAHSVTLHRNWAWYCGQGNKFILLSIGVKGGIRGHYAPPDRFSNKK